MKMKKQKNYLAVLLLMMLFAGLGFAKDPGDKIDDFSITNYDNKTYTLSDLKDSKAVVIIFWSAECPFVQAFNDRINSIVKPYLDKGITFWGINSNQTESAGEVQTHFENHGYLFPVLKDNGSKIADLFDAQRTPEVFILNSDRVILYHGRIEDSQKAENVTTHDMQNALDEILAGKDVSVKTTKSFGCTIKRNT